MTECLALVWACIVGYCTVSCTVSLSRIVKLMEKQDARK